MIHTMLCLYFNLNATIYMQKSGMNTDTSVVQYNKNYLKFKPTFFDFIYALIILDNRIYSVLNIR